MHQYTVLHVYNVHVCMLIYNSTFGKKLKPLSGCKTMITCSKQMLRNGRVVNGNIYQSLHYTQNPDLPVGSFAPRLLNLSGSFKNVTISCTSAFASSI